MTRPSEQQPVPAACPLNAREVRVLTELASGETQASAARRLGITAGVVRNVSIELFAKLGVRSIGQAAAVAVHYGWLPGLRIPPLPAPPPRLGHNEWRALYRERVAQMRQSPGTAVDIGPYPSYSGCANAVWRMRKGLLTGFAPAGSFDAHPVRVYDAYWFVRARYLGTPEPATTAPGGGA